MVAPRCEVCGRYEELIEEKETMRVYKCCTTETVRFTEYRKGHPNEVIHPNRRD